ncbi:MAG: RluA family pseudouridine synthase, partial [Elusimicrobiota bacterium]
AFANRVPRGDIGVIGASGTGTQEVTSLIAQGGRGISHALGVGGRDLAREVGALSTLAAIDLLDADPATRHIVVISKPGGTLSHPTDKVLHNTVTHLLTKQLGRKVYLAHRLDRETSGTMVLALDVDAARSLYEQFVAHGVRKEYLAVVFGAVSWTETVVDAPLGEEGKAIRVRRAVGGANGQSAVTEFRRLATDGRLSLVSAMPRTGRLHQIRAHLAHIGHPLVGDKLYCGDGEVYMKAVRKEVSRADLDALGADRQLLHAWRLSFKHPGDGRALAFTAPVPDDFPLRPS